MQKTRSELKDIKQFGIVLAGLLIIFGAIHFIKHRLVLSQRFFVIGVAILCISMLVPKVLRPVYNIFTKAAHAVGWFNTRLLLIFIYYAVVTPIAFIMKILGKDLLNKKIDKEMPSYWVRRKMNITVKERFEKQF